MNNTWTGIQLAQSGKRTEALDFLRRAVHQEQPTAEVWLWLAHVTPNLDEYRQCVAQALRLDPYHAVAHQMQNSLKQQLSPIAPPSLTVDSRLVTFMENRGRARRRRRFFITLLVLALLAALGAVGVLILSTQDDSTINSTPRHLAITLSNGFTWHFEANIPTSWILADSTSSEWLNTRENLPTAVWSQFNVDLSTLSVNAASGEVTPKPTVIDTNPPDAHAPLRLQLAYIRNVGTPIDSCADMQQWVNQTNLTQDTIVAAEIVQQQERCVFVVHYSAMSILTDMQEHIYVLHVPVNETTIAEWHLTVSDTHIEHYSEAIESLTETLRTVKS